MPKLLRSAALLATALLAAAPAAVLTSEQQSLLAKGHRHEKAGWIYLHVEGDARALGFQHGYLLAKEIAQGLRATRAQWEYESSREWSWFVAKTSAMLTPRIDAELLAELSAIAEGMKAAGETTTRAELIAYNGWLELDGYWWPEYEKKLGEAEESGAKKPRKESCSSFIATGKATADGGIVLGHNTMNDYVESQPRVVMDLQPSKGHRVLMQTTPGWIHSGTDFWVSDAGIVGSETTIGSFSGFDPKGIAEFARMRRATQDAGTLDEWVAVMRKGNNGGYANAWLLGDVRTGEIARFEQGLKYDRLERTKDGYYTGSNVAEDPKILRRETKAKETDIRMMGVSRRVRWQQLMKEWAGRIDLEAAKAFEADHVDTWLGGDHVGGRSLCAHPEADREPTLPWPGVPFGPGGTVDGKVVDSKMAKRMAFAARWGASCGRPFDADAFLAEHPQFSWMKGILTSRPSQPWVEFTAGETAP